jgi:hypothetical protein
MAPTVLVILKLAVGLTVTPGELFAPFDPVRLKKLRITKS